LSSNKVICILKKNILIFVKVWLCTVVVHQGGAFHTLMIYNYDKGKVRVSLMVGLASGWCNAVTAMKYAALVHGKSAFLT